MPVRKPATSRNAGREESRRKLLEAAAEVFSQTGFRTAKAAEIAERAGVAVGTLYLHFSDKDGIARAVALDALADLRERLRAAVARPGMSIEQAARAHATALVDFVREPGNRGRLLFADDAAGLRSEILDAMAEAQEKHIRERRREGYFRSDVDPAIAAQALVGMQTRVLTWWIQDPKRASRAKVIDTLARLRLSGIHDAAGARSAKAARKTPDRRHKR